MAEHDPKDSPNADDLPETASTHGAEQDEPFAPNDDIDAQIAAMKLDGDDEADEFAMEQLLSDKQGSALMSEVEVPADITKTIADDGNAAADSNAETAPDIDRAAAGDLPPDGSPAVTAAAAHDTQAPNEATPPDETLTDESPVEASRAAEPQTEELDSALKAEVQREVDAAFDDKTTQPASVPPTEAESAVATAPATPSSAEPADDDIRRQIADMGMDLNLPAQETAKPSPPPPAAESPTEMTAEGDAAAAPTGDDGPAFDQNEADKVLAAEMAQLAAAQANAAAETPAASPAVEADGTSATAVADASNEAAEAVAQGERAALMDEKAEATAQADDTKQPAGKDTAEGDAPADAVAPEPDEWPAWVAALMLLPLKVLVAVCGLVNLPFRWVDPDTRTIVGRMAIAALVVSLLVLLTALILPLVR
jgi:hypothetical protein